ncbi:MAG: 4-hydroxy-tetrahydrodipicolinate synthase [Chitinophagales bacterium]
MTAMITPFQQNLEIDFKKARELAASLFKNDSGGIVVCGTTGESPALDNKEKLDLFTAVLEEVGGKAQVWAGVGSNSTQHSIELARQASGLGVDGLMLVAPYYNKPTQEGLYQHFAAIAEAVKLPIMLYNIPGRTGVNMLPETVNRLANIDNIVALKEASGIMDQMSHLKNIVPDDFIIYSGDDSLTLPLMSLGAHGVVSIASHLVGPRINKMIESYISGRMEEARLIHASLFNLYRSLFILTNPIPLKEAMRQLGKDSGILRLPLCEPGAKERIEIEQVLKEYNFL